ncbi:MAG: nucleoside phosphorylase-I family protein [Acidiphilium sp.]
MIGFVTGLTAEARLLANFPVLVEVGGGTAAGALEAARRAMARGATQLVSFGLAGGLDPNLPSGRLLIPRRVLLGKAVFLCDLRLVESLGGATADLMLAGEAAAISARKKQSLFAETGAIGIDLESGGVVDAAVEKRMPFAVLRAIVDTAETDLPPASLAALRENGTIAIGSVMASLCRNPGQLPALMRLARDAARARLTLRRQLELIFSS